MTSVRVVNVMGSDITVVNAARVSYGEEVTELKPGDQKLLKYLATHNHMSPFRHVQMQLHIKCPEFVARQLYKHVVGIECTSESATKDHAWNEISGRYVNIGKTFWHPKKWRSIPGKGKSKQGSGLPIEPELQEEAHRLYNEAIDLADKAYIKLQLMGVCKEQARAVLPVSFYTEFYWTASLQALHNVVELRCKPDTQAETREVADLIAGEMLLHFPYSSAALKMEKVKPASV